MSSARVDAPAGLEITQSSDGAPIAYQSTGSGAALVLVVGAFCDRTSTASLTPLLCDGGMVPSERLARIVVPVLAISGGESPPGAARACADVAAAVPEAGTRVLAGQTHGAADDVLAPC